MYVDIALKLYCIFNDVNCTSGRWYVMYGMRESRATCKNASVLETNKRTENKMASKSNNNGKKNVIKGGKGSLTQEQIIFNFNQLRQEQRNLISKINELEMDQSEHR